MTELDLDALSDLSDLEDFDSIITSSSTSGTVNGSTSTTAKSSSNRPNLPNTRPNTLNKTSNLSESSTIQNLPGRLADRRQTTFSNDYSMLVGHQPGTMNPPATKSTPMSEKIQNDISRYEEKIPTDIPRPLPSLEMHPVFHKLEHDNLHDYIYPTNLSIREYQYNIVKHSLLENTLCALPTGLGKTFIASTIMLNFYRWTTNSKIIFMAPTKPLVTQQIKACLGITGIPRSDSSILMGNLKKEARSIEWQSKRVFFATPQTVENDLKSGILDAKSIVCLVVDEAHKSTGRQSYAGVIEFIMRFNTSFRILALTATPASTVEGVQEVIDNLRLSRVEIRTEESPDIVPYIHKKEIQKITVTMSEDQQHLMDVFCKTCARPLLDKMKRYTSVSNIDPQNLSLFAVTNMQRTFRLSGAGKNKGLSGAAYTLFGVLSKVGYAIQKLKQVSICSFYSQLLQIKRSAELADSGADVNGKKQRKNKHLTETANSEGLNKCIKLCEEMMSRRLNPSNPFVSHPKMEYMISILKEYFASLDFSQSSRVIIFAKYREITDEIFRTINEIPECRPHIFIGQASKVDKNDIFETEPSDQSSGHKRGMTQKEQQEVIAAFTKGTYNVLVATSIGEEGLDIGEVDVIICYDSSASPIRVLQRMGRTGRKRNGRVYMLLTESEERNFEKSLDNYRFIQNLITENGRADLRQFHGDADDEVPVTHIGSSGTTARRPGSTHRLVYFRSARILPETCNPVAKKMNVEIPEENKALLASTDVLKEAEASQRRDLNARKERPKKRKKSGLDDVPTNVSNNNHVEGGNESVDDIQDQNYESERPFANGHSVKRKKVVKQFQMPDNVITGFRTAGQLLNGTDNVAGEDSFMSDTSKTFENELFSDPEISIESSVSTSKKAPTNTSTPTVSRKTSRKSDSELVLQRSKTKLTTSSANTSLLATKSDSISDNDLDFTVKPSPKTRNLNLFPKIAKGVKYSPNTNSTFISLTTSKIHNSESGSASRPRTLGARGTRPIVPIQKAESPPLIDSSAYSDLDQNPDEDTSLVKKRQRKKSKCTDFPAKRKQPLGPRFAPTQGKVIAIPPRFAPSNNTPKTAQNDISNEVIDMTRSFESSTLSPSNDKNPADYSLDSHPEIKIRTKDNGGKMHSFTTTGKDLDFSSSDVDEELFSEFSSNEPSKSDPSVSTSLAKELHSSIPKTDLDQNTTPARRRKKVYPPAATSSVGSKRSDTLDHSDLAISLAKPLNQSTQNSSETPQSSSKTLATRSNAINQSTKSTRNISASNKLSELDTSFIAFKRSSLIQKETESTTDPAPSDTPANTNHSKPLYKPKTNPSIYHFDLNKYPKDYGFLEPGISDQVSAALHETMTQGIIGTRTLASDKSVLEQLLDGKCQLGTSKPLEAKSLEILMSTPISYDNVKRFKATQNTSEDTISPGSDSNPGSVGSNNTVKYLSLVGPYSAFLHKMNLEFKKAEFDDEVAQEKWNEMETHYIEYCQKAGNNSGSLPHHKIIVKERVSKANTKKVGKKKDDENGVGNKDIESHNNDLLNKSPSSHSLKKSLTKSASSIKAKANNTKSENQEDPNVEFMSLEDWDIPQSDFEDTFEFMNNKPVDDRKKKQSVARHVGRLGIPTQTVAELSLVETNTEAFNSNLSGDYDSGDDIIEISHSCSVEMKKSNSSNSKGHRSGSMKDDSFDTTSSGRSRNRNNKGVIQMQLGSNDPTAALIKPSISKSNSSFSTSSAQLVHAPEGISGSGSYKVESVGLYQSDLSKGIYTRGENGMTVRRKRKGGDVDSFNNSRDDASIQSFSSSTKRPNRTIEEAFKLMENTKSKGERQSSGDSNGPNVSKQRTLEFCYERHKVYKEQYKNVVGRDYNEDILKNKRELGVGGIVQEELGEQAKRDESTRKPFQLPSSDPQVAMDSTFDEQLDGEEELNYGQLFNSQEEAKDDNEGSGNNGNSWNYDSQFGSTQIQWDTAEERTPFKSKSNLMKTPLRADTVTPKNKSKRGNGTKSKKDVPVRANHSAREDAGYWARRKYGDEKDRGDLCNTQEMSEDEDDNGSDLDSFIVDDSDIGEESRVISSYDGDLDVSVVCERDEEGNIVALQTPEYKPRRMDKRGGGNVGISSDYDGYEDSESEEEESDNEISIDENADDDDIDGVKTRTGRVVLRRGNSSARNRVIMLD